MATDLTTPDPAIILELIEAFRRSKALFAAVALGVFEALAGGPKAPADLADELGADRDALGRLLDACVGLRLLARRDDRYENTSVAAAYLTGTSPHRLTGYITYSNDVLWKLWADLEGAVREGTNRWRPVFGREGALFDHFFRTEAARREFLMGMHGLGLLSSPQVVAAFDLGRFRRLVDLGGATGHLALAACRRWPGLRAVVFDLPGALPLAREVVGASPEGDRIEFAAGDFFTDSLPEGDLFALGRILHDWGEQNILRLLGRIHDRLPPGGAVLIAETLLHEGRDGPGWAQMQHLNMLVCTEGRERTLAEYEALLGRAGFGEVLGRRTGSPLDAIFAVKAGGGSAERGAPTPATAPSDPATG